MFRELTSESRFLTNRLECGKLQAVVPARSCDARKSTAVEVRPAVLFVFASGSQNCTLPVAEVQELSLK